jgi:hypothetical protein
MRLRTYNIAPLFLGTDGLTEVQSNKLDELLNKIKLTEKQAEERDKLIAKRDADVELPVGAKSLIESYVDANVYDYWDSFDSKEVAKGRDVEDQAIELYNRVFFTDHKKMVDGDEYYEIHHNNVFGHPDIVDVANLKVKDAKSSWSKKTFPKTPEKAENSTYTWQVKTYLYMLRGMTGMDWREGEVFHALVTTPEELVPDYEHDSLHFADNLADNLRVTVCPVYLSDDDIVHMNRRLNAAFKYAAEYKDYLLNKNK